MNKVDFIGATTGLGVTVVTIKQAEDMELLGSFFVLATNNNKAVAVKGCKGEGLDEPYHIHFLSQHNSEEVVDVVKPTHLIAFNNHGDYTVQPTEEELYSNVAEVAGFNVEEDEENKALYYDAAHLVFDTNKHQVYAQDKKQDIILEMIAKLMGMTTEEVLGKYTNTEENTDDENHNLLA